MHYKRPDFADTELCVNCQAIYIRFRKEKEFDTRLTDHAAQRAADPA